MRGLAAASTLNLDTAPLRQSALESLSQKRVWEFLLLNFCLSSSHSLGQAGLLFSQRNRICFCMHHVISLLMQNGINSRRQFAAHSHDGFFCSDRARVPMINTQIKFSEFRILADGGPGSLNQFTSQAGISGCEQRRKNDPESVDGAQTG